MALLAVALLMEPPGAREGTLCVILTSCSQLQALEGASDLAAERTLIKKKGLFFS